MLPAATAGRYTDPETGLIYLRARYYDPTTAQFLTRDPLDATTRSAYGYAGNDPLNGSDPWGLCSWTSWKCDQQSIVNVAGGTLNGITLGHGKQVLNTVGDWVGKKNNADSVNWNSRGARDGHSLGVGLDAAGAAWAAAAAGVWGVGWLAAAADVSPLVMLGAIGVLGPIATGLFGALALSVYVAVTGSKSCNLRNATTDLNNINGPGSEGNDPGTPEMGHPSGGYPLPDGPR